MSKEKTEKKVPVLRTANSLIEDEFDSLRSRFDQEMRLMEEEMDRFKRSVMHLEGEKSSTLGAKISTSSTKTTSSTRTTTSTSSQIKSGSAIASSRAAKEVEHHQTENPNPISGENQSSKETQKWPQADEFVGSPLIVDDNADDKGQGVQSGGRKMLRLRFDLADYEPEQIVVKTIDNRLQVYAKRQEVSQTTSLLSEYNREFLLPLGTDPESIRSTLSADGVLTVDAPLNQLALASNKND